MKNQKWLLPRRKETLSASSPTRCRALLSESITFDKSIQTEFSRTLGLTEHYDDLEDLTTEKLDVNAKLRKEAIWKVSSGFFSVMHW